MLGRTHKSRIDRRTRSSASRLLTATVMVISLAGIAFAADEQPADSSPRGLYNDGTRKLRAGKLSEAESSLQGAVTTQNENIQPQALYNLGEVRFKQGDQARKDGPNPAAVHSTADHADKSGDGALSAIDAALAGNDQSSMVAAYMRGRGARKELKAAIEVVQHAMEIYGGVLTKWQRASGDFKGAHELRPSDIDAKANAEEVDRCIARLVDLIMPQIEAPGAGTMEGKREELKKKMKELKKKLANGGEDMKGMGDDDDDDDSPPKEPKEGDQDSGTKDGKEMHLSMEEAERLLKMLKLDGNRKLSLGGTNDAVKPKDRKGRDW